MNPQIKRIIRKISKKSKASSDNAQNNNATLPKRKFSFFRYSMSKLNNNDAVNPIEHRKSIDIAEIQRRANRKTSTVPNDKIPINIIKEEQNPVESVYKSHSAIALGDVKNFSPKSSVHSAGSVVSVKPDSRISSHNDSSQPSHPSVGPVSRTAPPAAPTIKTDSIDGDFCRKRLLPRVDKTRSTVHNSPIGNESTTESVLSKRHSTDYFQFILRKLFNYPNNFYICLSYIITVFLLISTLYVAYQVDKLESNLVHLIEKNHNDLSRAQQHSPDWSKNRQILISQIERLSKIMKTVQKKLS